MILPINGELPALPGGIILIKDELTAPPSSVSSFRELTMILKKLSNDECAILIETEDADPYVKWLRRHGAADFVEDFISPGLENGLRIDTDNNFPNTIVTNSIVMENLFSLLGKVRARFAF